MTFLTLGQTSLTPELTQRLGEKKSQTFLLRLLYFEINFCCVSAGFQIKLQAVGCVGLIVTLHSNVADVQIIVCTSTRCNV